METKPAFGLSIDQIDEITLEICHAEVLTSTLHGNVEGDSPDRSLFMLLEKQLAQIKSMVEACKIGGRHHGRQEN